MAFKESHTRSITKALLWRLTVIVSDSVIVYSITREWALTFSLVSIKSVATTILYYLNERVWDNLSWGRQKKR